MIWGSIWLMSELQWNTALYTGNADAIYSLHLLAILHYIFIFIHHIVVAANKHNKQT